MEVTFKPGPWLRLSLLSLTLVACIGVIMRYKIGFEFPWLSQKNLQHAHSHFAFSAWVSHTLFVLMILHLQKLGIVIRKIYKSILFLNLIFSLGMLISFTAGGYNLVSIALAQSTTLLFYLFAYHFIRDLGKLKNDPSAPWFRAALWFGILSGLGTYALAYMTATHQFVQKVYLASVYFYLHFQYNGWFFFACTGLILSVLNRKGAHADPGKTTFILMAWSCIPAYLLSVLWLNLSPLLWATVAAAAVIQSWAWIRLMPLLIRGIKSLKNSLSPLLRFLFLMVLISVCIKFALQLGSTIPSVSKLAFGFRPIVIAYLHLVLLAITSLYLILHIHAFSAKGDQNMMKTGLVALGAGIFLNEGILAVQGIASFSYTLVPGVNEMLFAVSLLILLSVIMLLVRSMKTDFD